MDVWCSHQYGIIIPTEELRTTRHQIFFRHRIGNHTKKYQHHGKLSAISHCKPQQQMLLYQYMRDKLSNNIIGLEKQTPTIEDSVFDKVAAMDVVPTRSLLPKMMNKQETNLLKPFLS